jgi:hemerythrin-like domain-containing protein
VEANVCDHCGCRAFPAIAELTADHETILSLAWQLAEAVRRGGTTEGTTDPTVRDELLAILDAHVVKEETGLYPLLLAAGDLSAETSGTLQDEHRTLRAALTGGAFDRRDFYALAAHTEQEELELFPAAMFAFDDEEWNELASAHQQATTLAGTRRRGALEGVA